MTIFAFPVTIEWGYATGSPGANVWHGRTDGDPAPSGVDDQSNWIQDFYTALADRCPSEVSFSWSGEAVGVGSDVGAIITGDPWTINGTGTGDRAPTLLAGLVQWKSSAGGRKGRGRLFHGPLQGSTENSDGTPTPSYLSDLLSAAQDLVDASDSAANGALGIFSRSDGLLRDFVSAQVSSEFAVLRSRRD